MKEDGLTDKDKDGDKSLGGWKQSLGQEAEVKQGTVKVVVLSSTLSTNRRNQLRGKSFNLLLTLQSFKIYGRDQ